MKSNLSLIPVVIGLLIVSTVALPLPVQATTDTSQSIRSKQAGAPVNASFVVHPKMNSPHEMRVEATFEIDSSVSDFNVRIFNDTQFGYATTVDSASGFTVGEAGSFILLEHDGETKTATVTYTIQKSAAGIGKGNPQPMIAGEDWMVFSFKGVTELSYPRGITVSSTTQVRTDRPVTRGNTAILIGERTLYNHSGAKQDFTLVVPEAADMVADPGAVLDLMDTTTQLFPGETPGERSFVFVLPENAVGEAPTALALSPDAFVAARSQLNQAGHRSGRAAQSVWAHEVTHIQHMFSATKPPKMRWISEGHSDYVAAYASYMEGIISFDRFYNWTQYGYPGEEDRLHDDVLSKPSTHDGSTLYSKGRRVTLALDAKIRQDTGGKRTVFDVFYLLNQTNDGVSLPEFKAAVEQVAGRSYDEWIDKYVTTSAAPTAPRNESLFNSMPNSDVEKEEFVPPSQRIPENLSVSATYRIEHLPDQRNQIRVTATFASKRLSWVTVSLPDRADIRAELLSTTGVQPERGDGEILLVPAPERTEMQAKFVLWSDEGFPQLAAVDDLGTLLKGVSYRPDGVAVNQKVVLAGEAGSENSMTDGSSGVTSTDGQPGLTPISAIMAILVTVLFYRVRGYA